MKRFVKSLPPFLFTFLFAVPICAQQDDPPPPSIMDWIKVFEESAQSVPQNKENLHEEVPPIKKKSLFYGSFTLCAGMLFGGMNEYVYEKGHKEELNRLEWEEYFVPCIELCGEFGFWNVFVECAILSAVPVKSGKMRDHDYMLEYVPDILSMFSEHDAMLDGHFELKVALGYKFNFRRWYIAPAAGFLYRGRKWSAMDGYTQYPSDESSAWTPEVQKKETAGTIITYHEATYMVPVLLKGGFYINDMFKLGGIAVYYPYINISTIDTHIMRNPTTRYHDNMEGFRLFSLAGELYLVYHPKSASFIAWTLNAGWQGVFPGRGTTQAGTVGYITELTMDNTSQSRSESSIFRVSIGFVLSPRNIKK